MKTYNSNSTEARVLNTINNGKHEENAICTAAGMRDSYPEFCRALWQLQRDGVITYINGEYYASDPETLERESATADRMERERKEAKSQTPAEVVETLNECTTAHHHTTAARVAHICQTIAEAVGVCYGSTLPAFDMVISLQQFDEWQTAITPNDEMNPAAPFFFAVRKQGTESGTREHCKERCSILGAPVYVIKVEREEAAGLFTLKVRVSSPATGEHVAHVAELAKTIGKEAAARLGQFGNLKEKHPAALLIFRENRADAYTLYNEDADTAAGVLGETISAADGFRFVTFPAANLNEYLPRLIRAGHRCAICEQVEEPKQPCRITEKLTNTPAATSEPTEEPKGESKAAEMAAVVADYAAGTWNHTIKPAAVKFGRKAAAVSLIAFRFVWFTGILAAALACMFAAAYIIADHLAGLSAWIKIPAGVLFIIGPSVAVELSLLYLSQRIDEATGRRLFAMH